MLQYALRYLSVLLFVSMLPACIDDSPGQFQAETFTKLEKIRTNRKAIITSYLDRLREKSLAAKSDQFLVKFFSSFHRIGPKEKLNLVQFLSVSDALDRHYVDNYAEFYDILFVNEAGLVFHSIKMEWDYGKNLFDGQLAKTKLARSLRTDPGIRFVDYDYYSPSKEPASFFVTQVQGKSGSMGWLVFQFSVNTVNSVLADYEDLGVTGEVYLANEKKMMLTQSRLVPVDTILKKRVNTTALKNALEGTKDSGNMVIEDYRGVRVFSSFEKFIFEGITWVIVAEIDEDEVVTDHYKGNKEYYLPRVIEMFSSGKKVPGRSLGGKEENLRVDINEYAKGGAKDTVATYGVATCTGILVSYPKRFVYLGHINPLDEAYHSFFGKLWLNIVMKFKGNYFGEDAGDLLKGMLKRIKFYDIPPFEIRNLRAVTVAVHTESFEKIIDKLIDAGFFLSQITVLYGPGSKYANIWGDVPTGASYMEWVAPDGFSSTWTTADEVRDLGWMIQSLSGYSSDAAAAD